jgi:hypothetical protein
MCGRGREGRGQSLARSCRDHSFRGGIRPLPPRAPPVGAMSARRSSCESGSHAHDAEGARSWGPAQPLASSSPGKTAVTTRRKQGIWPELRDLWHVASSVAASHSQRRWSRLPPPREQQQGRSPQARHAVGASRVLADTGPEVPANLPPRSPRRRVASSGPGPYPRLLCSPGRPTPRTPRKGTPRSPRRAARSAECAVPWGAAIPSRHQSVNRRRAVPREHGHRPGAGNSMVAHSCCPSPCCAPAGGG